MSKIDLFLELAQPNENGFSRWVNVSEFKDKYESLKLGNGGSWCRKSSSLQKTYIVEFDKMITSSNSIDAIRLVGFNKNFHFRQSIRNDIRDYYKNKSCVITGANGNSENTIIEIDHKDGQKNNERVSNTDTQTLSDFQPLCKAANDIKRQICKNCILSGIRWDATQLEGFPISYYKGGKELKKYGCEGCYWFDPVEYRKYVCKNFIKEINENS